ILLRLTMEGHALSYSKYRLDPGQTPEPHAVDGSGGITDPQFETTSAAAALDESGRPHLPHDGHGDGRIANVPDGDDGASIEIPTRKVPEQVACFDHARRRQNFTAARAHALNELDRRTECLKEVGGVGATGHSRMLSLPVAR